MESNRDAEAYRQSLFRQVSELPACNVSKRWASLVTAKIPVVEPFTYRRRQYGLFQTG